MNLKHRQLRYTSNFVKFDGSQQGPDMYRRLLITAHQQSRGVCLIYFQHFYIELIWGFIDSLYNFWQFYNRSEVSGK